MKRTSPHSNPDDLTLQQHKDCIYNALVNKLKKEGKEPFFDDALKNLYRLLTMYFTKNQEFEDNGFIAGEYEIGYSGVS